MRKVYQILLSALVVLTMAAAPAMAHDRDHDRDWDWYDADYVSYYVPFFAFGYFDDEVEYYDDGCEYEYEYGEELEIDCD